jgi:hypothetical protein
MVDMMEADRRYRDEVQRTKPGQKVHLLVTVKSMGAFPPGTLRGRQSPSLIHPTSGYAAVVSSSASVRTVANTMFRLIHYDRARFFENTQSALAYLQEIIAREKRSEIETVK